MFWLEFIEATELLVTATVQKLQSEANQLVAIFSASQKTAKSNYEREKQERTQKRKNQQ